MTLDVHDLCTPELQEKLIPMRDKFKEEDDRKIEAVIYFKIHYFNVTLKMLAVLLYKNKFCKNHEAFLLWKNFILNYLTRIFWVE